MSSMELKFGLYYCRKLLITPESSFRLGSYKNNKRQLRGTDLQVKMLYVNLYYMKFTGTLPLFSILQSRSLI